MAEPRGSTSTGRGSPLGRGRCTFRYRSVARQQFSAQLRRIPVPALVVRRVEAQELLVERGQGLRSERDDLGEELALLLLRAAAMERRQRSRRGADRAAL